MQQNITEMLGKPSEQEGNNPLAKLDEATRTPGGDIEKPSTANLDEETIKQLLMTGENTRGMFSPDEKVLEKELVNDELHAEQDESMQLKTKKADAKGTKYEKNFQEDISKNPSKYSVMTPRGVMTVAEAMREGYDPLTKRFNKDKSMKALKDKYLEGLNEADKAKIEELTDPSTAKVPFKEAKEFGIDPNSALIDRGEQPQEVPAQPGLPLPEAEEVPQGAPTPDINALLGGAR